MPRQTRKFRGGNVNLGEFNENTYYSLDYEYVIQAERIRSEHENPPINLPLHLAESSYKPNKSISTISKKLIEPNVGIEPSQGGKKNKKKPKKFTGGASNLNFQNIDITQFLIRQWQQMPAHAGFPTTTLSIFNPCFTHLFNEARGDDGIVPSIYLCTCRVIYHYENNAENADLIRRGMPPRPLNNAERTAVYRKLAGEPGVPPIYIIGNQGHAGSQRSDEHEYIIHPGSVLATPWYNPYGNWGGVYKDTTMICMLRLTNTTIEGINTFIPSYNGSCPIDARVFKVNRNDGETTVFVTGSCYSRGNRGIIRTVGPDTNTIDPLSRDANFNGNFDDEDSHPLAPPPNPRGDRVGSGWKHGLLRLKYTFNEDGTVRRKTSIDRRIDAANTARRWRPNQYTEETLADCTAWIGRIEKNYAMYCDPRGRMALNYHLTWGPSPNEPNNTMVFYTKPYNGTNDDFETFDDQTWTVHRPPNSDIFDRIDTHYGNLGYMHWTCTSPFLLYNNELHAAGHMKIMFQMYLDRKLNEWIATTGPAHPYDFDSFENYFSGAVDGVRRDHLLHSLIEKVERFSLEQIQNPYHGVDSGGEYVRRILNFMKPNPRRGQPGEPDEIRNGQRIPFALSHVDGRGGPNNVNDPTTWRPVFHYLIHKRFYVVNADGSISAPKNVHPDYLYYMFFYSVDPDDFHLIHFSNPFMIEHEISSYLDFPVGLTQLGPDMLLSYGHGDCYSYLAKFPQDVYDDLLRHTNDADINDIEYNLYNPTGGQIAYNEPTLAETAAAVAPAPFAIGGPQPGAFNFGAPAPPFAIGGPQPGAFNFGAPAPPFAIGGPQAQDQFAAWRQQWQAAAPAQGFAFAQPAQAAPAQGFAFAQPAQAAPAQGFAFAQPAQAAPAPEGETVGNQRAQTQANFDWLDRELARRDGGSKRKRNPKRKTRRIRK